MSESVKNLARRYFEAYSTGDVNAVAAFCGSNYILHPGGGGEPMNLEQRKRDEEFFFSAFSNVNVIVEDQIAEGDVVVSRVTAHCLHSGTYQGIEATGKQVAIPYIDITLIKAGKIVEEWVEYDTMNILRQLW